MKKIILGSAPKNRKSVLEGLGYTFDVLPADIDEKAIRFDDPRELTLALAHAKADAVAAKIDAPALIITSDQVVVYDGTIREKPADEAEARAFLESYSNSETQTVTSVVVTDAPTGERREGVDTVTITYGSIPEAVIEEALAEGKIFSYAGALLIDEPFRPFVKSLDGERESVYGLPPQLTQKLFRDFL